MSRLFQDMDIDEILDALEDGKAADKYLIA